MRAGAFLTLCVAIATFSAAALLLTHAARLDFEQPTGATMPVDSLAPRCYSIWPRVAHFPDSLPFSIRLTSRLYADFGAQGTWYRLEGAEGHFSQQVWRPVGLDSLDLVFAEFPKGFRFRIPSAYIDVNGRARGSYDVGAAWPGTIHAVRTECLAGPVRR
jgi:hypothetical protein